MLNDRRAMLTVLCVPALLWIVCWPFVDSPVNDDFSYAFTAKRLLETGRLTYNGWASPMLGPQALWGAAFAWIFGFSHDILRVSMLPVAIGCAALAYRLHRRFDIPPVPSLFATLLLAACPLFTAWSASFMNDLPGLFFTLWVLHALVGAMACNGSQAWKAAILIAGIGLMGGAVRQSVFVIAFAALAMTLLRHRKSRSALIGVVLTCGAYLGITVLLAHWQARQPFSIIELWPTWTDLYQRAFLWSFASFLELGLYLLPLGVAFCIISSLRRNTLVVLAFSAFALAFAADMWASDTTAAALLRGLWTGNTITPTGLLDSAYDAPGYRPVVFGNILRLLLGAAIFWQLAVLMFGLHARRSMLAGHCRSLVVGEWSTRTWTLAGLVAVAIAYIALLVPRAAMQMLFDRYLLVLLPIATVLLLVAIGKSFADRRIPLAVWAMLGIYAYVGVACTHDHFSELRTRDRIASQFAAEGVGRHELANGLAFDAWTQLLDSGYVNDFRIRQPRDAYVENLDPQRIRFFWFLNHTPVVQPTWIISNWPAKPAQSNGTRVYSYNALLPPFTRWIVAWPAKAVSKPVTPSSEDAAGSSRQAGQ